jgi:hypothetical protein
MLKYIGKGSWFPGIPARDLSVGEVKKYGGEKAILATGLYKKVRKPRKAKTKLAGPPSENKAGG